MSSKFSFKTDFDLRSSTIQKSLKLRDFKDKKVDIWAILKILEIKKHEYDYRFMKKVKDFKLLVLIEKPGKNCKF